MTVARDKRTRSTQLRHYVSAMAAAKTVFLFLAFFSEVAWTQNPQLVPCDSLEMQNCQSQFNDNLKIDASLGVKTYAQLRTAIERKFANGQAYGLLQTCEAFKEFKFCFTGENYYACAENPLGLIATNGQASGITTDQAYGYTKQWNQLDFVCGAGFSIFANAETCASTVFGNSSTALRDCDYQFDTNSKANPERVCSYLEVASNCYRVAFFKVCPQPEVGWWGCNYDRAGNQLNYPQCTQIFCSFHEIRS